MKVTGAFCRLLCLLLVSLFIIPAVLVLAALVGMALMRAPLTFDSATVAGSVKVTSETLFNTAS